MSPIHQQLVGQVGRPPEGQQTFTSVGTTNFTVPEGVTQVHMLTVGGGSGGGGYSGGSAGGGGLGWRNNVSVTPGETLAVYVGMGGSGGGPWSGGSDGGDTHVKRSSTVLCRAYGGEQITSSASTNPGTYDQTVCDGGGNGGRGTISWFGPGQGAGGYSGNGGEYNQSGSGGGGAGGAGGSMTNGSAGGGGGVGILGEGTSGSVGGGRSGGGGGSGGQSGDGGSTSDGSGGHRYGGDYGGGGGGCWHQYTGGGQFEGGAGAARIIWGTGRSYPDQNTGDV